MGKISICEENRDLIIELNNLGFDRWEIAEKIGTTKHSLQSWMQHQKIPALCLRGKSLLRHKEQIRQMIEQERMTLQQVAKHFCVHRSTLERAISPWQLKTNRTGPRAGKEHGQMWKGGRILSKWWYIDVYAPLHPLAKKSGYVSEHRLMMEVVLGRYLTKDEVVDHRDSHTQHNWPSNLRLYATNKDHLSETLSGRYADSRVRSIFGEWQNSRRNDPIPSLDETLAQCPLEIRQKFETHVQIHRPTKEHSHLSRKRLLRTGPLNPPFE